MYKKPYLIHFWMILLSLFLVAQSSALEQDRKSIAGRLNIEVHDEYVKVSVFLTNKSDKDIAIVTGAGGASRGMVPGFSSGGETLVASRWQPPSPRKYSEKSLTLKPDEETLYDVYIIPRPPGDTIEGNMGFRAVGRRDFEYLIEFVSQKLRASPIKNEAEQKK